MCAIVNVQWPRRWCGQTKRRVHPSHHHALSQGLLQAGNCFPVVAFNLHFRTLGSLAREKQQSRDTKVVQQTFLQWVEGTYFKAREDPSEESPWPETGLSCVENGVRRTAKLVGSNDEAIITCQSISSTSCEHLLWTCSDLENNPEEVLVGTRNHWSTSTNLDPNSCGCRGQWTVWVLCSIASTVDVTKGLYQQVLWNLSINSTPRCWCRTESRRIWRNSCWMFMSEWGSLTFPNTHHLQ